MNTFEHPPDQNNIPEIDDDTDEDFEAFVQRVEQAYASTLTHKDELTKLYETKQFEAMNNKIDELADGIAENSPEFMENISNLKQLRTYRNPSNTVKEEIAALTNRQNELYGYYRSLVINDAELPDEARFTAIEQARNSVAEILKDAWGDVSYTAADALDTLGIRTVDDDKVTLRFPEELVPESTNELWQTYLAAVCAHVLAESELENKSATGDQTTVVEADRTRTFAHNAVTREVHAVLNLQPDHPWENADTRKLLASIRDQVLSTREIALTKSQEFIDGHQESLDAVRQLSSRSNK